MGLGTLGVPPLGFLSLYLASVCPILSFLESSVLLSTCRSEFVVFLSILRKAREDFRLPILGFCLDPQQVGSPSFWIFFFFLRPVAWFLRAPESEAVRNSPHIWGSLHLDPHLSLFPFAPPPTLRCSCPNTEGTLEVVTVRTARQPASCQALSQELPSQELPSPMDT